MKSTGSIGDVTGRAAVIHGIRDSGQTTRVDLASQLGLSASTVTRIVSRLLEEGLVMEGSSIEREAVGRRPTALSLNGSAFHLLGVEISDRSLTAALVSLGGDVQHQRSLRVPAAGRHKAVDALQGVLGELITTAETRGLTLRGIGIGAPGATDVRTGHVLWAPALQWRNLPLRDIVETRWGLPTFVENDINLAAFGEYWFGAGKGAESLAYLYVGEGIGAGLIHGGSILRGAHHSAGEVGYVLPGREHLLREHRDVGAMEAVASGAALAKRYSGRRPPKSSMLPHLLQQGAADERVAEVTDYLAMVATAIVSVVDPELIVLGGDLVSAPRLARLIRTHLSQVAPATPDVVMSSLGPAAGVLGAAALALLEVESLHLDNRSVLHA